MKNSYTITGVVGSDRVRFFNVITSYGDEQIQILVSPRFFMVV
jgi:hypothetical protein